MSIAVYHHIRNSWLGRNIAVVLTVAAFISAIATYFVITSSDAPLGIKPRRVLQLLVINITLLTLLVSIIGMRIYTLWSSLRTGSAGSKLQKRILILFSLVTIIPTIIVSIFSALFFNIGIQSWFNDRVQTAVNESLAVAEAYVNEHKENIRADAIAMANDLDRVANLSLTNQAEFQRIVVAQSALRVLTESMVFRGNRIIAQGRLSFALTFERLPQNALDRAAHGEVVLMTDDTQDKVRALVKLSTLKNTFLLIGRLIDRKVLDHMENAQGAVSEYNNLQKELGRLQITFSVMFITLALLLLFSSIWYGMVFAARLTNPISRLVMAAERVRGGDFSARVSNTESKDEVGMLSRAFNRMTAQLEAQRGELIDANRQLDERRRFSEAVLSGVSAGVIALDRNKNIHMSNRSASAILEKVDQKITPKSNIAEILPGIVELLVQAEDMPGETVQATLTLDKNGKTISLHVRITVEKLDSEIEGFIVTFDDITLLVNAQRNAAWADVARRVAHEIKNPLTPIQLSAERLKRKYTKYAPDEEQENFAKYTDTIAKHVADIGKMVEEFVSFARMPTPKFSTEDLAGIIRKAVFSSQVSYPTIDFNLTLPDTTIAFICDERQITQVLTNLLKNAAEAVDSQRHKSNAPNFKGTISVALNIEDDMLELTVSDNGSGFPQTDIQKMLDPYITTRSKGTGLGLAIVKKIVEDHKGNIALSNNSGGGARVVLSFPQQCDINASIA